MVAVAHAQGARLHSVPLEPGALDSRAAGAFAATTSSRTSSTSSSASRSKAVSSASAMPPARAFADVRPQIRPLFRCFGLRGM